MVKTLPVLVKTLPVPKNIYQSLERSGDEVMAPPTSYVFRILPRGVRFNSKHHSKHLRFFSPPFLIFLSSIHSIHKLQIHMYPYLFTLRGSIHFCHSFISNHLLNYNSYMCKELLSMRLQSILQILLKF